MRPWPAALLAVLAVSACSPAQDPPRDAAAGVARGAGASCGTVDVPAHEGVDVRAVGLDCAGARDVVRVAEGRGRAAYEVDGFACTPSPAPDGDTFYECVADGGKRVTFRYGVA